MGNPSAFESRRSHVLVEDRVTRGKTCCAGGREHTVVFYQSTSGIGAIISCGDLADGLKSNQRPDLTIGDVGPPASGKFDGN